jgi:hypothetical protein
MDYKEKAAYVKPPGLTYINPKSGEKIILRSDQEVPEGFIKKGGRKTRKSKRKTKKRSVLNLRKVR